MIEIWQPAAIFIPDFEHYSLTNTKTTEQSRHALLNNQPAYTKGLDLLLDFEMVKTMVFYSVGLRVLLFDIFGNIQMSIKEVLFCSCIIGSNSLFF